MTTAKEGQDHQPLTPERPDAMPEGVLRTWTPYSVIVWFVMLMETIREHAEHVVVFVLEAEFGAGTETGSAANGHQQPPASPLYQRQQQGKQWNGLGKEKSSSS